MSPRYQETPILENTQKTKGIMSNHTGIALVPEWEHLSPTLGAIYAAEAWPVCDNGRLSFDKA